MVENSKETTKPTIVRRRSPNYPTINIEKAISMVTNLYEKFQRNQLPAPLAMEAMGYSIRSGKAQSMLASLSYYNLVQVERGGAIEKRKVNISPLGYNIVKNPDENERFKAIQEAAIKPMIYRKLLVKFPQQFPQDRLLAWELETNFGFNPKIIPDFIEIFRQTIDFAKVYELGIMEEESSEFEEKKEVKMEDKTITKFPKPTPPPSSILTVPKEHEREIANYPIRGGTIRLLASGAVTQKAIDKLIKMLELSKEEFPLENEQPLSSSSDNEPT